MSSGLEGFLIIVGEVKIILVFYLLHFVFVVFQWHKAKAEQQPMCFGVPV
jgi:hypothetical protein